MKKLIVAGVMSVFLLAAAAQAQKVKVNYNKQADFSRYKTYSWDMGMPAIQPEADAYIKAAIDMILADRGWKLVAENPDARVVYYVSQNASTQVVTDSYGYGAGDWYWRGMPGAATPSYDTYRKGTIVVDIVDVQSKQMVWRGSATDTIFQDRDKMVKTFQKMMDKMWKNFPPKK